MNEDSFAGMTILSQAAYNVATQNGLSPASAALLLDGVEARSFRDVLLAFAPEENIRALLVNGLCANDCQRSRDSVDKKVRGWLGGKYRPTKREDLWNSALCCA